MIPVADTQLAEQYGVPVSVITQHREKVLELGVHWEKDNKRVLWLAKGLASVAEMVAGLAEKKDEGGPSAAPAASEASGEGDDSSPAPRRTAEARVLIKHPNPCFVRCHIPGDKTPPFDVRLRNHRNIGKNALLPVSQLPDGSWICTHPHHTPRLS